MCIRDRLPHRVVAVEHGDELVDPLHRSPPIIVPPWPPPHARYPAPVGATPDRRPLLGGAGAARSQDGGGVPAGDPAPARAVTGTTPTGRWPGARRHRPPRAPAPPGGPARPSRPERAGPHTPTGRHLRRCRRASWPVARPPRRTPARGQADPRCPAAPRGRHGRRHPRTTHPGGPPRVPAGRLP